MSPVPVNQQEKMAKKIVEKEKTEQKEKEIAPLSLPHVGITEKEVRVENNLYNAIFTSKGGVIKKIELKNYKDKKGNPIVLKSNEVLPPLGLGTDEDFQLSKVNFSVRDSEIRLNPQTTSASIIFEYSSSEIFIRRIYTLYYNDYRIDLTDEVKGLDSYWLTLGKDFGIYEKNDSFHYGPVILKDTERLEFKAKKLAEQPKIFKEGIKWIAQEDKYFFSAIVPKRQIEELKLWSKNGDALVAIKNPSGSHNYLVYAGPKEYDRLKKYGVGLQHIVDFGFFSILARPLFWLLKQFYSIIPNYGIAIIFLTILVRIPFIPLINKGQKSMKKLQDIQPKMAEIREKYKSDPQRMQKELMELYKKHKVNPMGGCLPMLLQIPVFFALYKVLMIAIELRGAPFMLWITDLSSKDPYYILPIIMGVTMVIQQKMTPSTMEPTQQKLMMIMPVIFTFMFFTFPSGLVLYWLVNNILSIIQQFYINKQIQKAT
jgi:YidC/Oxa1 family membrane protein insertase